MITPGTCTVVTVTQDHIRRGKRADGYSCPIALALTEMEIAEPGQKVSVGLCDTGILDEDGDDVLSAHLPPEASDFARSFDAYREVQPLTFELTWARP